MILITIGTLSYTYYSKMMYLPKNYHDNGKSPLLGDTSSFMVGFLLSFVSFPGRKMSKSHRFFVGTPEASSILGLLGKTRGSRGSGVRPGELLDTLALAHCNY